MVMVSLLRTRERICERVVSSVDGSVFREGNMRRRPAML
jgi:hypothetical protein